MSPALPMPTLSIVTSLYRSAPFIREFHARASAAARVLTDDYEIVYVNDGSPDDSLAIARGLLDDDPRVRVLDLSRNFGHHRALMTGLARATGDLVFLVDVDLEEDPAWLGLFHQRMTASGADVVFGVQDARKGGWFERLSGAVYYGVVNRLMTHPIPANVITARLMTRRFVRAFLRHREREVSLIGLMTVTGFEQESVVVRKAARDSASSYSLARRVSVMADAVTAFSNRPLVYIFQLGVGVMLLSMLAGAVLVYQSVTRRIGVPGYASLMVSIWFLGGLVIFCVGVLGVYLSKMFSEVKRRPLTIVRREYRGDRP